jgi:hypothetical protein
VYDLNDRYQIPGQAHLYNGYKGGADGRSHRGDFIFRLKCADAEILVPRQLMQNIAGPGNGV